MPAVHQVHSEAIWSIAALFACCAAMRLARFNVETDDEDDHSSFEGLPSPAAAAVIASFAVFSYTLRSEIQYVNFEGFDWWLQRLLPLLASAIALLMVSRIPYPHSVTHLVRGQKKFPQLVAIVFAIMAVWSSVYAVSAMLCGVYALAPPLRYAGVGAWRRRHPREAGRSSGEPCSRDWLKAWRTCPRTPPEAPACDWSSATPRSPAVRKSATASRSTAAASPSSPRTTAASVLMHWQASTKKAINARAVAGPYAVAPVEVFASCKHAEGRGVFLSALDSEDDAHGADHQLSRAERANQPDVEAPVEARGPGDGLEQSARRGRRGCRASPPRAAKRRVAQSGSRRDPAP